MTTTKFAWISRHTMTEDQLADLRRIYGEEIEVEQVNGTFNRAADLSDVISRNDVIGVVLPINLISDVLRLASGKPVIRAINRRIPTGRTIIGASGAPEQEFIFQHGGWERIEKVEVVTHLL